MKRVKYEQLRFEFWNELLKEQRVIKEKRNDILTFKRVRPRVKRKVRRQYSDKKDKVRF
jgi:hypothetical protein